MSWITAERTGDQVTVEWGALGTARAALATSTGLHAAGVAPARGAATLATTTGLHAIGTAGHRVPLTVIEWATSIPNAAWATAVDTGWTTTVTPAWKTTVPPAHWTTEVDA